MLFNKNFYCKLILILMQNDNIFIIITPFGPEYFYYTVKNQNNAHYHFFINYSGRFVTNMWTFTMPLLVGKA